MCSLSLQTGKYECGGAREVVERMELQERRQKLRVVQRQELPRICQTCYYIPSSNPTHTNEDIAIPHPTIEIVPLDIKVTQERILLLVLI